MGEEGHSVLARSVARFPVAIYLGWAVAFVWLLVGGRYRAFLQPKLWPFVVLGTVVTFLYLASALAHRPSGGSRAGGLATLVRGAILALPLLYLFTSYGKTLGVYALSRRSLGPRAIAAAQRAPAPDRPPSTSSRPGEATSPTPRPETATTAQTGTPAPKPATVAPSDPAAKPAAPAAGTGKPVLLTDLTEKSSKFRGKSITVEGSVYKGEDLPSGYFLVFRFLIICCVADAQPVGVLVRSKAIDKLENDDWVRIGGEFDLREIDGEDAPCIEAREVKTIPTPPAEEQYLY